MSQLPNGRGNGGGNLERTAGMEPGTPSSPRTAGAAPASKSLSQETLWDESGFPRRHKAFDVANEALNERWKSWQRQISSQLISIGSTWILHGSTNTGKTQMATECARDVCHAGSTVYYLTFNWMGLEVDSTAQPAATQTAATYGRKLLGPRLLVVDDVNPSYAAANHLQFLANLVSMRHDNCLDTILLSGEETESLESRLPSIILQRSRLNDGLVRFSWSRF